jgi:BirA family biotin operon repressor/biotin-[acetyl-CoA-carboxylase] ligase
LYNSIQDTLIIGKKVIYLPSCHSTNDIAAEIVRAGLFTEGTVVITDNQLSGRGQRGTTWVANPGENLTFSIILSPVFLQIDNQFLISQAIALAVKGYLENYISGVQIKWPNDVLVNGRKICGVLIENSIQGAKINTSVAGIGLNINQLSFENDFATSLSREAGIPFVLSDEFVRFCGYLDAFYIQIRSGSKSGEIRAKYMQGLYGYSSDVKFSYKDRILSGRVIEVNEQGQLSVRLSTGEELTRLGLKEITWLKN